jgi:hypothetical protein
LPRNLNGIQEAGLSRKPSSPDASSFFTDQEVYFECSTAPRWETLKVSVTSIKFPRVFLNLRPENRFDRRIGSLISKYSRRDFTLDSDALNGILAVLRYLRELEYPVYHHRGVPILDSNPERPLIQFGNTDGFTIGLCWLSKWPGRRRPEFPSWSWSGWTCPVAFRQHKPYSFQTTIRYDQPIQIHFPVADSTTKDFDEFGNYFVKYEGSLPHSKSIRISALTIELQVGT